MTRQRSEAAALAASYDGMPGMVAAGAPQGGFVVVVAATGVAYVIRGDGLATEVYGETGEAGFKYTPNVLLGCIEPTFNSAIAVMITESEIERKLQESGQP